MKISLSPSQVVQISFDINNRQLSSGNTRIKARHLWIHSITRTLNFDTSIVHYYLQFDHQVHNYIEHNNYEEHAPTCFDI